DWQRHIAATAPFHELCSVEAHEPRPRPEPEIPAVVLRDRVNHTRRQPILYVIDARVPGHALATLSRAGRRAGKPRAHREPQDDQEPPSQAHHRGLVLTLPHDGCQSHPTVS